MPRIPNCGGSGSPRGTVLNKLLLVSTVSSRHLGYKKLSNMKNKKQNTPKANLSTTGQKTARGCTLGQGPNHAVPVTASQRLQCPIPPPSTVDLELRTAPLVSACAAAPHHEVGLSQAKPQRQEGWWRTCTVDPGKFERRPNSNPHRPANRIHAPSAPTSSHLGYNHVGVVHYHVQHQRDSCSCYGSC
jgi:hypothetical protein